MSENMKYLLLGVVLAAIVVVILMPMYGPRRPWRPWRPYVPGIYLPYYAHGGGPYRPGVLY
jgi:hypothetical protein